MAFEPWIGNSYKGGFRSRKLLIVGESHHDRALDGGNILPDAIGPAFTQNAVRWIVEGGETNTRYWRCIQNRVGGEEHRWISPYDFWHAVAFYSFVQSIVVGGPGRRPTGQQWTDGSEALIEMLKRLKPDRVLFVGCELWRHVPKRAGSTAPIVAGGRSIPLEWFDLTSGHRSYVSSIPHPRSSKCGRSLEPATDAFIRRDLDVEVGQ